MKKITIFFIAIIFSGNVFSQANAIEWQNTIGGSGMDELFSIQQTNDGGYILGGRSVSNISGDKTENCIGSYDYWIVKTDSLGNIQWQNTIGGNDWDDLQSMQQTADGGYILGGYSESSISGDKTEYNVGPSTTSDYWIVKIDASGNIQWQNTIGGTGDDKCISIQQTTDRGYILGGNSNSMISGDKTENAWFSYDYWMVKTDSLGNIQWQNTIGGTSGDYLTSIQQTADGGYVLGGFSDSNFGGDKSENCMGNMDYWIVKTDSLGNIQWQNTIGGSGYERLQVIKQTMDGGYILGGWSDSNISGDKAKNSIGGYDYWIVKTDASGNILWQNTIGGTSIEYLHSMGQTADGGYILGGYSPSNISGDKTENRIGLTGAGDYWIIKTDLTGNIQWQNTIGGNSYDECFGILQTADGGYIVGGESSSNISGDKAENCIGPADYWIVKLTDKYNYITGNVFADLNTNAVKDTSEPYLSTRKVTEQSTGRFGFSYQNGQYSVAVLDSGNFAVAPSSINYYSAVPASHTAYFPGIHQIDSLNDFAFQPTGVFNDLCLTVTPLGAFRAGSNGYFQISYENVGTTTINPTVIFFLDSNIAYSSASPAASSVAIDSIVWNFGPLAPFQTGSIFLIVHVNFGTPINTLILAGARIEPVAGDANPSCNISYWEIHTTGSFDPNDIIVDEDTLWISQFPNPPYLEYIVRFQNTGNDTAFNVKVLNPIDTSKLELNTLEFVASSHPVNMQWNDWERNMQFNFNNILLPDSNVNEPESHGFVRYRIKPKSTLIAGDSIINNAAIYFDFNAPVITNNATTRIVLLTSTADFHNSNNLEIFPNPTIGELTIENRELKIEKVELYNTLGEKIFEKHLSSDIQHPTISIADFLPGIYFITVTDQAGNKVTRKVVKM